MEELCSAGVQTLVAPAPFNAADKQRFATALDNVAGQAGADHLSWLHRRGEPLISFPHFLP